MGTNFQTNAQVFLVVMGNDGEKSFTEWSGPIPVRGDRIRLIDGNEVRSVVVSRTEWVVALTGDFGADAIAAPSEVYIHGFQFGEAESMVPGSDPEIVSANTHPVHDGSIPDPES